MFSCTGFRRVAAETPHQAAMIFANRAARRAFGRRGYCRVIRHASWTKNGMWHSFEAFIGYDVSRNETTGYNTWIDVIVIRESR
jgi:hypothetical protein